MARALARLANLAFCMLGDFAAASRAFCKFMSRAARAFGEILAAARAFSRFRSRAACALVDFLAASRAFVKFRSRAACAFEDFLAAARAFSKLRSDAACWAEVCLRAMLPKTPMWIQYDETILGEVRQNGTSNIGASHGNRQRFNTTRQFFGMYDQTELLQPPLMATSKGST